MQAAVGEIGGRGQEERGWRNAEFPHVRPGVPLQPLHCPRREERRRLGNSPKGAPFSAIPPSAYSSLLSECGAHQASPSRVSLPGIFSLSKSPCCLEVPSRLGLERKAWLRRGVAWLGGAGRAREPGRGLERQQRRREGRSGDLGTSAEEPRRQPGYGAAGAGPADSMAPAASV